MVITVTQDADHQPEEATHHLVTVTIRRVCPTEVRNTGPSEASAGHGPVLVAAVTDPRPGAGSVLVAGAPIVGMSFRPGYVHARRAGHN